jgi:hypothetical protein
LETAEEAGHGMTETQVQKGRRTICISFDDFGEEEDARHGISQIRVSDKEKSHHCARD